MVVEVHVVSDAGAKFFERREGVTVEVLVLEDRPEALGTGVVVTRTGLTHRSEDVELLTERDDLGVVELTAAIRVEDHAGHVAASCPHRHLQGVGDDLGAHARRQLPPQDPRGALVTHATQVDITHSDLQVRDVARPEHVGLVGVEVTLDKVLGVGGAGRGHRGDLEGAWADPGDP